MACFYPDAMCEAHSHTAEFEAEIKRAILTGAVSGEGDAPNLQAAKDELREAIGTEYHKQVDDRKEIYQKASELGDTDTMVAAEDALESAKEWMSGVFAAGHSRLNKATDAYESGDIEVDITAFDPTEHTDGEIPVSEMDIEVGDMVPVAHSASGNSYALVPSDDHGHTGSCYDKVNNDGFPVCKHEMVWLLTEVLLYNRGMESLVDEEALGVLVLADSESQTEETTEEPIEVTQ